MPARHPHWKRRATPDCSGSFSASCFQLARKNQQAQGRRVQRKQARKKLPAGKAGNPLRRNPVLNGQARNSQTSDSQVKSEPQIRSQLAAGAAARKRQHSQGRPTKPRVKSQAANQLSRLRINQGRLPNKPPPAATRLRNTKKGLPHAEAEEGVHPTRQPAASNVAPNLAITRRLMETSVWT